MITLRELHRDFAAEVAGVDMREPPGDALLRAMADAIDRYPVLVLRNQDLTDASARTTTRSARATHAA